MPAIAFPLTLPASAEAEVTIIDGALVFRSTSGGPTTDVSLDGEVVLTAVGSGGGEDSVRCRRGPMTPSCSEAGETDKGDCAPEPTPTPTTAEPAPVPIAVPGGAGTSAGAGTGAVGAGAAILGLVLAAGLVAARARRQGA